MPLIDPTGRIVNVSGTVSRIISLVPSLTETLFDIGAGNRVVGVSDYCTHPAGMLERVPKVGGPKSPLRKMIESLRPDLLLLNREENSLADYEWFAERFAVYASDVRRVSDVPDMLREIGELTDCWMCADEFAHRIEEAMRNLRKRVPAVVSAATLIWRNPLIVVGRDTYSSDLLRFVGVENCFGTRSQRYPSIEFSDLVQSAPQAMLFPSEPYPWTSDETIEIERDLRSAGVTTRRLPVDGRALNWYGTRTLETLQTSIPEWRSMLETIA